jgi:capsular exopolysaccharide synthesis family protein
VVAEQCHSVATTIYSLFLGKPPRSLAVVSSASRDGKTLTCVNLAAALSARGKRVLLVDADLRRGRLHTLFTLPRVGGLFELATGQIEAAAAIRKTFIPNVDVIPCGEVPDKVAPARVLELPHLRTVVATLRDQYDLVLFDTAPVPMVSDVLVMKDLFDGAVGVFRAGQTSVRISSEMERHLAAMRVPFLGWVLNGVSEKELRGRYYSRYGYGAYGAYGAYEQKRGEERS